MSFHWLWALEPPTPQVSERVGGCALKLERNRDGVGAGRINDQLAGRLGELRQYLFIASELHARYDRLAALLTTPGKLNGLRDAFRLVPECRVHDSQKR
jgi:hypothetical protein